MGGSKYFTLIHHLTVLNVELRPKDPVLGRVVAFEAEMRDDGAPPRLVLFEGPATDLFRVIRPRLGSRSTADNIYDRPGLNDSKRAARTMIPTSVLDGTKQSGEKGTETVFVSRAPYLVTIILKY